jgi:hypothetical protein
MSLAAPDIFDFWREVPGDARCHPLDEKVLARVDHQFNLECLLGPYMGRLQTAPVVLLFLSPGFDVDAIAHGKSPDGVRYYTRQRDGFADLPCPEEHGAAHRWILRVLKQFEVDWSDARSKVAFLNISPYKSKDFKDGPMLASLPSCRAALDWAQSVLFPQAERGERLVVCLRSAAYWGLGRKSAAKGSLIVPNFTRSGVIFRSERDDVVRQFHRWLQVAG